MVEKEGSGSKQNILVRMRKWCKKGEQAFKQDDVQREKRNGIWGSEVEKAVPG